MGLPLYNEDYKDALRILDEKFVPVEEDRFKYCLQGKKWSIEGIQRFKSNLEISLGYVSLEYERMKDLRPVYNLNYENDHKKYFSTMADLMSKMRSTLSAHKNSLNELRPRGSKKASLTYDPTSLHKGTYSKDLFGWEPYMDDTVRELYETLNKFLKLARCIYKEAMEIIKEENDIRSDPEKACPRYDRSFKRSAKGSKKIIDMMKNSNLPIDNDIVEAMETAEDVRALIADMFHTLPSDEWNFFCVCKTIHDGRKAGMTREESLIFGKDNEKTMIKLRTVTDHIQELTEQREGVIGWKGKLDGEFVMRLLFWCGWNGSKNQDMLDYITKRCEGKIGVVKMGAVMAEKRKLAKLDSKERIERQDAFNKEMDAFVNSVSTQQEQDVA